MPNIKLSEQDYIDIAILIEEYCKVTRLPSSHYYPAVNDFMLKIGEIYDLARARALREQ